MESVGPAAGTVCGVCCAALARYTCPHCGTKTCSLPCYRSHKASCGTPETPQPEEEDAPDNTAQLCALLERLGGDDTDAVLSDAQAERLARHALTEAQLRAFERGMQSGALLRDAVGAWTPWWLAATVDSDNDSENERGNDIADPPLGAVRRASPLVRTSLVAWLAAYALVQRYLCGDWACAADAWDAARGAVALLDAQPRTPPPTEAAALHLLRATFDAAAPEHFGANGSWLFAAAVRDTALLLQSTAHAHRAMRDLAALLARAARFREFPEAAVARSLAHKARFLAAWARAQDVTTLAAVQHAVTAFADTLEGDHGSGGHGCGGDVGAPRVLIEEISPEGEKETI